MYMFHWLNAVIKLIVHGVSVFFHDFLAWCYSVTEEGLGSYIGFQLVANINIGNEIVHSLFQWVTAIVSAYTIYKLKQIKFKVNFKNIKSLFKKLLKK